ncbi:MAG: GntR family transcriptional regulator [Rhodospirillales bacterium]|nr:GntR family transcriptional regulator [Rhodospirillales bacterium]
MGTALLYRRTRGVEPTPAGETLARHARSLIRLTARMEAEMSEFAEGARGHVRIVANTSAITQFLPNDLLAYKTGYPDVRIQLREETSAQAVHDVSEGLADIAIFSEAVSPGELEVYPYRQDHLAVIAPVSHPLARNRTISFSETLPYVQVGLQDGSSLHGQLVARAQEADQAISFAVQVTSFDGVRRMVEGGLGIAILPAGTVLPMAENSGLQVIPLADPWARRTLYVGVREAPALSRVARKLLEELVGLKAG